MNKVNSFCKQFEAAVKGDETGVMAQKAWRQAESALKVQISTLDGDVIKLEDDVTTAQEKLNDARINKGKAISDRETYISNLMSAKNTLTIAEKALKDHNTTLGFLKGEYEALKAE